MSSSQIVTPEAAQPLSGTAAGAGGGNGPGSPPRSAPAWAGGRSGPGTGGDNPLEIAGYASLFWVKDLNDDVVASGAFAGSLARTGSGGIRMLYQHESKTPVGVWDTAREDPLGLYVRGRIISASPEGRLAAALVRAGALDGLSIGFRAVRARADPGSHMRVLTEVDLWEVSLVTFPMLPGARLRLVEGGPSPPDLPEPSTRETP